MYLWNLGVDVPEALEAAISDHPFATVTVKVAAATAVGVARSILLAASIRSIQRLAPEVAAPAWKMECMAPSAPRFTMAAAVPGPITNPVRPILTVRRSPAPSNVRATPTSPPSAEARFSSGRRVRERRDDQLSVNRRSVGTISRITQHCYENQIPRSSRIHSQCNR